MMKNVYFSSKEFLILCFDHPSSKENSESVPESGSKHVILQNAPLSVDEKVNRSFEDLE